MAVGVFDSGIGGMTVAREIRRVFPEEKIIYFGDTLRVPYGGRETEELKMLADMATGFLINQGADVVIDACNTTSALALPMLQAKYEVPVLGVLAPGAKEAARTTKNGKIGVIATEATVGSGCYEKEIKAVNSSMEVISIACPKLVGFIEDGDLSSEYLKKVMLGYLNPIFLGNCDTLILGCTHYPFLREIILELIGESMTLVDPAVPTMESLRPHVKGDRNGDEGEELIFVSGDYHHFYGILMELYGDHGFSKVISYDPMEERD